MMKLGFVSAILPDLSLDEVIAAARELDYDCVELMCWPLGKAERRYAGVTHLDVNGLTAADAAAVRNKMAAAGLAISGLGYYPNPLAPNEEEAKVAVAHILKVIDAAKLMGIPVVNTFIGRDWTKSVEDNWPRFLETWKPIIRHAESRGIRVGIENCPMLFSKDEWPGGKNLAQSPAIWRRMFHDIPSDHFGLNYDPSHLVWQMMDPVQPLKEFATKLFHIHLKDARIDRDHLAEVGILAHPLQYHTPKLPGSGEVNWGRFFSILGDTGYRGPVCVEVEDRVYEGSIEARKASLWQAQRYLRQFVPKA